MNHVASLARALAPILVVFAAACGGGGDTAPQCTSDAGCGAGQHCDAGTCVANPPPANQAPTAAADAYTVAEDGTLSVAATAGVLANDADPDGDSITAALDAAPAAGALTLQPDGSFTYSPAPDLHGTITFTYRASDGALSSGTTAVTVTVTPVADAPVALADAYVAPGGAPLVVAAPAGVLANDVDPDGDPLSAATVAVPAHGALALGADGGFAYTAVPGFSGTDRFTYLASDGALSSAVTEVVIDVPAPPAAPAASPDAYEVAEDAALDVAAAGVLANDTDANGDPLSAGLVTAPASGTVTLAAAGGFRYVPAQDFAGADAFTYRASDGTLLSTEATVSITVTPVPDAPAATPDAYDGVRDRTLTVAAAGGVLANDADADGDPLQAVSVTAPSHGTVSLSSDGSFSYFPGASYVGPDAFTYRASDGALLSPVTAVSITVTAPPAHPPVAAGDTLSTLQAQPLEVTAPGVLANDSDPDGDAVTAVLKVQPAHGAIKSWWSTGAFRYVPEPTFVGTDSFTYQASDSGGLLSAETTVTIAVTDRNLAPVALTDAFGTAPDRAFAGTLRGSDLDGDPLSFALVTPPSHGAATLDTATGAFTYTPETGFEGGDAITFSVSDGSLSSEPAPITLNVAASRPRWTADGVPTPRRRPQRDLDRERAHRMGRERLGRRARHGRAVRALDGHVEAHLARGRPVPPLAPHRGVDRDRDDRVGGQAGNFPVLGAGARYRPATDSWSATSTVGAPSARTDHAAVWTGTEMIICGGRYGVQVESASYRYDPATDAWSGISSTGSACNRDGHAAVWTGSEMIVWGGNASGGGRYDPAANTWSTMSNVGAPAIRLAFAAVWTGTELVVWGGYHPSTFVRYADGARYDPATDTWTPLPALGAPSARYAPGAVWTGSKVLVWGGMGASLPAADGMAFDPVAGTWSPLPVAGAPTARSYHTAIWSGTEMIVFGGQVGGTGSERLASGARLDPVAGTWTATPESGAPTPRNEHTALWTGSRLLVWGGRSALFANTGGSYDPVARTWTPLPTAGAPAARSQHCAVWTGEEMIVVGERQCSDGEIGRRPRPGRRHLARRLHQRCAERVRRKMRLDRLPDDRVGRDGRSCVDPAPSGSHRRELRPGERHLESRDDARRAEPALRPLRPLDGQGDDRVGRERRLRLPDRHVRNRRSLRSGAGPLAPDLVRPVVAGRPLAASRGVDGRPDDRLGRLGEHRGAPDGVLGTILPPIRGRRCRRPGRRELASR